jgi:quercetin dioxygenase-like cupin family protein
MSSGSRVVRTTEGGWGDVERRAYKDEPGAYVGVVRHTLLGGREAAERLGFEVRYFEVEPGGYSSLERHRHAHAVVVLRGTGSVRLGDRTEAVRPFDVVYVAPDEVHRFQADRGERLGFLCVVDADRDRPVPVRE